MDKKPPLITRIKVSNFKSFGHLDVQLKDFNILIGANAAGKSNFIHVFEFLRDIVNFGLENAVSMQGDRDFLRNVNLEPGEKISFEIFSEPEAIEKLMPWSSHHAKIEESIYKFSIKFSSPGIGFEILEDCLSLKYKLIDGQSESNAGEIGAGVLTFSSFNEKITPKLEVSAGASIDMNVFSHLFPPNADIPHNTLLLETPFLKMRTDIPWIIQKTMVYDFDPKGPKKAIPLAGKSDLEEDGSNLAIALKKILDDKEKQRRFSNLINDVLPVVESVDVKKLSDKSLIVRLRETYNRDTFLPASFLSDGTLNITALMIAFYFDKKPVIIIEEPERNLHPALASKILEMMKEVASKKQIIVTTHSPELLKHADPEDILFIARDKDGFSNITRPVEKAQVRTFLENEMGMDELYVQNLLEL